MLVPAVLIVISGCAGVISKPVIQQVNQQAELAAVVAAPGTYTGDMVLWSGRIIATEPLKEGTLIEILHKPSDFNQRPEQSDRTQGRFLALNTGYLDPAIYETGREVTIAGRFNEMRTRPLGEIDYTYPLVAVKEIYLWPQREKEVYLRDDRWPYRWPYHRGYYPGCCRY